MRTDQVVVANTVSQFFSVDSYKVDGKDPLEVRFLGERITYVGRTEMERSPTSIDSLCVTLNERNRIRTDRW